MMIKKNKRFLAIGLVVAMFLTGCSGNAASDNANNGVITENETELENAVENTVENTVESSEGKTIKWLHHYSEDSTRKWIDEVTKLYTEKTGVQFDIQAVSFDEYQTLLKAKIASDDAPDLFDLTASDLVQFEKNSYVEDLSNAEFWNNIVDGVKDGTKLNDKNYFMPLESNASAAYYNVEVFEKAGITKMPETYSEFIEMLQKLEDCGVIPISFGAQEAWTITNDYRADMLQQVLAEDAAWMTNMESRTTKFAEDQTFVNTLEKFKERHQYGNKEQFGTDWNKATEMVATGEAAMVINGSWSISAIKEKNPEVEISCFPVPGTDNKEDTRLTTWSGDGFVVYSGSEVKQEVIDFMSVMTGQESGMIWQNDAKRLSVIKGLPQADDPALAKISEYMNAGQIFDVSSMQNEFVGEYYDANVEVLTRFLLGEIKTPDEAAVSLDKKFDEIKSRQ